MCKSVDSFNFTLSRQRFIHFTDIICSISPSLRVGYFSSFVNCSPSNLFFFLCLLLRLEPMKLENAAYPFLAFTGIPSLSFRFTASNSVSISSFLQVKSVFCWKICNFSWSLLCALCNGVIFSSSNKAFGSTFFLSGGLPILWHDAGHPRQTEHCHVRPGSSASWNRGPVRRSHSAEAGPRPSAADGPEEVRHNYTYSSSQDQRKSQVASGGECPVVRMVDYY